MKQKELIERSKPNLLEIKEAYEKAMLWFFSYPQKEMSLSDLSSELGIAKTTANIVVEQLEKDGFLKKEVLGKIWRITCNTEHILNASKKIGYNLIQLSEYDIVGAISKIIPNPQCIILFGSYRWGYDNEKSDIDLAVEVIGDEAPKIIELGELPEFLYRKNIRVNAYIFSRNKIDLNLFSNIANGIVLKGFLEVRP